MESIYTKLALYGSNNLCARIDTVFLPISEVCNGTVSLVKAIIELIMEQCSTFISDGLNKQFKTLIQARTVLRIAL